MQGPTIARLPDGRRLHLNHGPIDLIVEAWGEADEVAAAYQQIAGAFADVLGGLVAELAALRRPFGDVLPEFESPIAARMARAVWPHRAQFVTPMAAVAGAVADAMLAALCRDRRLERAYVNNGGDIALHLAPGQRLRAAIVTDLQGGLPDGFADIDHASAVRGIATSGRHGRSLSLGIADSVTVLARDAAAADAAATLIANAVDVADPAIERRPAREIDPDSDLGARLVTVAIGALPRAAQREALSRGAEASRAMRAKGLIEAAHLRLGEAVEVVGAEARLTAPDAA